MPRHIVSKELLRRQRNPLTSLMALEEFFRVSALRSDQIVAHYIDPVGRLTAVRSFLGGRPSARLGSPSSQDLFMCSEDRFGLYMRMPTP